MVGALTNQAHERSLFGPCTCVHICCSKPAAINVLDGRSTDGITECCKHAAHSRATGCDIEPTLTLFEEHGVPHFTFTAALVTLPSASSLEPDDQPQACAADAVWHLKLSKVLSILASGSYQGDLLRCRSGRCTCAHTTGAACRSCQENAGQQSSIRPCALGRCAWLCKRECNVQSLSRACHHAGEGEGSSWCEEGVAAGRNNRHQGAGCFIGVACKVGRHLRAVWARAPAT